MTFQIEEELKKLPSSPGVYLMHGSRDEIIYVGKAINPAHQNPNLPINFSIKMRLVDELAEALRKMGKQIKVSHF